MLSCWTADRQVDQDSDQVKAGAFVRERVDSWGNCEDQLIRITRDYSLGFVIDGNERICLTYGDAVPLCKSP
jgi:hypothetical protein